MDSNLALVMVFQTYTLEQGISAQLLIPQDAMGQRGELGPPFQRTVALRPSSNMWSDNGLEFINFFLTLNSLLYPSPTIHVLHFFQQNLWDTII